MTVDSSAVSPVEVASSVDVAVDTNADTLLKLLVLLVWLLIPGPLHC